MYPYTVWKAISYHFIHSMYKYVHLCHYTRTHVLTLVYLYIDVIDTCIHIDTGSYIPE